MAVLTKAPIPSIMERCGTGGTGGDGNPLTMKSFSPNFPCRLTTSLMHSKIDKSSISSQACQLAIESAQATNNSATFSSRSSLYVVIDRMMDRSNADESSMHDGEASKSEIPPS